MDLTLAARIQRHQDRLARFAVPLAAAYHNRHLAYPYARQQLTNLYNRYRHPDPDAMPRFRRFKRNVYNTPVMRTIRRRKRRFKKQRKSRKRRFTKRRRGNRRLRSKVARLSKISATKTGTHIFRNRHTGKASVAKAVASYSTIGTTINTDYETVINQLKFWDASHAVDDTTTTPYLDPDLLNAQHQPRSLKFLFTQIFSQVDLYNNYQVPVDYTLWCLAPRKDTNQAPLTAFTAGLANVGSPIQLSPLTFPTDSPTFSQLWKTIKKKSGTLQPGAKITCSNTIKNLVYDPAAHDDHTLTYQRGEKSRVWFLRLVGTIGHDSVVLTEQGNMAGAVDFVHYRKYSIKYDAGMDIKTVLITDNANVFTNVGLRTANFGVDNVPFAFS